jgi:hypothetical protein
VRVQFCSGGAQFYGRESLLFGASPVFLGARFAHHGDRTGWPELPHGAR